MWKKDLSVKLLNEDNLYKSLIGKTFNEAKKEYYNLRIIKENNLSKTITLEYCKDRCNIVIKNGIIIDIKGFY